MKPKDYMFVNIYGEYQSDPNTERKVVAIPVHNCKDLSPLEIKDIFSSKVPITMLKGDKITFTYQDKYEFALRNMNNGKRKDYDPKEIIPVDKPLYVLSVKINKKDYHFEEMSNLNLIDHIIEKYKGKILPVIRDDDVKLHREIRKRGLENILVSEGILVEQRKPKGFWKSITNIELIDYIKDNYEYKTTKELKRKNPLAYRLAYNRGILKKLIESNILISNSNL